MKKIIALFCAVVMMLGIGLTTFAAADSRGNCNGSVGGEVDIEDAMDSISEAIRDAREIDGEYEEPTMYLS